MVIRKIIKIDEDLCTGCGECIPNCPEGAIQLIDDKARIISDIFCDGLGACMGHCPVDAITIEEREAEEYDERKVMKNVVKQGRNVIKAHLEHLRDHNQYEYLEQAIDYLKENNLEVPIEIPKTMTNEHNVLPCGCPGSAVQDLGLTEQGTCSCVDVEAVEGSPRQRSELRQWPVQLMLVPPNASYLKNADLLIAADCVPVAYPNFHPDFLKEKIVMMGCPKFDNVDYYKKKLVEIFKGNNIKSITVLMMEVPCCFGLYKLLIDSIAESGVKIRINKKIIGVKGEVLEE